MTKLASGGSFSRRSGLFGCPWAHLPGFLGLWEGPDSELTPSLVLQSLPWGWGGPGPDGSSGLKSILWHRGPSVSLWPLLFSGVHLCCPKGPSSAGPPLAATGLLTHPRSTLLKCIELFRSLSGTRLFPPLSAGHPGLQCTVTANVTWLPPPRISRSCVHLSRVPTPVRLTPLSPQPVSTLTC